MSRENLEAFRALVWTDADRLQLLREATERTAFVDRLIELGSAAGYMFDAADIEAVMHENHLSWIQRWA
jgi:hypothetical protein